MRLCLTADGKNDLQGILDFECEGQDIFYKVWEESSM